MGDPISTGTTIAGWLEGGGGDGGGGNAAAAAAAPSDPNQAYLDAMMGVEGTEPVDYGAMYSAMTDMYEQISAMNEQKFSQFWPQSIQQGVRAAREYDRAGYMQANTANNYNAVIANYANQWLQGTTSQFNEFMRSEAGQSNEWIMNQVANVNAFNSEEFYKALETAMPGIMDTAATYKGGIDQMLAGALPQSVVDEIAQAGAERGLSSGIYGPSLSNAQLRDLGINRLQYLQAGQAQMPALIGVTQALTAPVATPNIYQNVMMTPTPYTPQPSYVQPSSAAALGTNYLSGIMGGTMMQPGQAINAAVQMGGNASQQNLANTQLQYAQAMSMLNYGVNQQLMAQQQSMFNDQLSAQQTQNWFNLGGSALGALGTLGGVLALGGL